jgi:APA family basic amino acid/polyamine antiporter
VIAVGLFFVQRANWVPFVPPSEPLPPAETATSLTAPLWQVLTGATPTAFGMVGVFVAAAVVFFAYSGFEAVANLGEETKNPKRDMPLGLLGTLGICTLLYMGVCLVLTGMVKYTDLSEGDAVAQVFREVGLGWAGVLIGLAAVAGLSSVILVDIVAMGRIGYALSRDGLLPPVFRRIHPTWNTPVLMTSLTVAVVVVLAAFVPLADLAEMVSIGTLFAFLVVSIAVPVLRVKRPDMRRPFRTPLSPVLPVVSGICCIALMSNLAVETWLRFLVWLVVGLIVYVGYSRRHARLADPEAFDARYAEGADAGETPRN